MKIYFLLNMDFLRLILITLDDYERLYMYDLPN